MLLRNKYSTIHSMLYTALIFFLAGFTQGVSGFGAGLVAMPLLTMLIGIKAAVPLSMLNGLIITGYLSLQLKRHIDWQKIMPLLLGCLPGIVLGAVLLKRLNADLLQLCLGIFIASYAAYSLPSRPRSRIISGYWGYAAGFLTGTISSIFSAGGPPAIIYVSLTNWAKDEIKATLSVFFFVSGIVTAIGHAVSGLTTIATLQQLLITGPMTLVGVALGALLYRRIRQQTYIAIMLWLLIVMGLMMIALASKHLLGQGGEAGVQESEVQECRIKPSVHAPRYILSPELLLSVFLPSVFCWQFSWRWGILSAID